MSAKSRKSETALLDEAVSWLEGRLPDGWSIERYTTGGPADAYPDSTLGLRASGGSSASIAVEVRDSLSPQEAMNLLPRLARVLHSMTGGAALLVVAPWLSERTRELLSAQQINYIDLTGNALMRLDNPAVYVETVGASRNPEPKSRGRTQLRGSKAARLIRLLADVRPPYGAGELAEATDLAPGYVSRLLDTLYREALIERSPRGPIESVDVPALLRRWASSYDVFKTNDSSAFVAPAGVDALLSRLVEEPGVGARVAITGSFAAARLAPVASPALLAAYCDSVAPIAHDLELLVADEGANVVLLQPFDPVVWQRTSIENGLRYVAPSQIAVDCLTGNGRMPAEGEALLEWMQADEEGWRLPSLPAPKQSKP